VHFHNFFSGAKVSPQRAYRERISAPAVEPWGECSGARGCHNAKLKRNTVVYGLGNHRNNNIPTRGATELLKAWMEFKIRRVYGGTAPKFCTFHKRVLLALRPVEHTKLRSYTSVEWVGAPLAEEPMALKFQKRVLDGLAIGK